MDKLTHYKRHIIVNVSNRVTGPAFRVETRGGFKKGTFKSIDLAKASIDADSAVR